MLRLPGGDTPSGFEVAPEQQRYVLYLTNDTECTRVSNVKLAEGELTAVFPGYENSLRATLHRDRIAGKPTRAMLLLKQRHDHLTGTVMTPTGDHRFLEGQVHGDELQLSTFAGGLAGRRARSAITART